MKLYTEEEVIKSLKLAHSQITSLQNVIDRLKSIELPSDEEIWEAEPTECCGDFDLGVMNGFRKGAIWMRDKIQGGKV